MRIARDDAAGRIPHFCTACGCRVCFDVYKTGHSTGDAIGPKNLGSPKLVRLRLTRQERGRGRLPCAIDGCKWTELAATAHYSAISLAKLCQFSLRQLERQFQWAYGKSPRVWLEERRLMEAQQLLLLGHQLKCIAGQVGFKNAPSMCR
jgi:AraC-like DNA-binding protein